MRRFKKGLVLPGYKDRSLSSTQIHTPQSVRFVTILLNQHIGAPITPCVQEGNPVFVGSKIAEASDWSSVPLHSSVSGSVSKVDENSITIESDEADRLDPLIQMRREIPGDADELAEIIREAGIVDLGGTGFATHVRLLEAREKRVEVLVLNGCESEPFLTADHMLMLNHPVEILKGSELVRIASGAKRAVIAVERNKLEAIEVLNSKNYHLKIQTVQTMTLPVRYPQGSERSLAEAVGGLELGRNASAIEAGILVENVATAFAVFEAVHAQKPLYQRVITVGGPCVVEPKNLWARVGTRAGDLIRSAKGLMRLPDRVVFGGPMAGRAIRNLEEPLTKKVQGILALSSEVIHMGSEEACVRCGFCIDVCPESLVPETLVRSVRAEDQELAEEYDLHSCTECGACAYICPSKIPIVAVIQKGKQRSTLEGAHPEPLYAASSQR